MKLTTEELDKKLLGTRPSDVNAFINDNSQDMVCSDNAAGEYIKSLLISNGVNQRDVFIFADIPERYGYKILSGEKKTRKRDVIIRICYAGRFALEQVNRALKLYGMTELYSRIPRDAMIMVCFNERPGTIADVNEFLQNNHVEPLDICGVQE